LSFWQLADMLMFLCRPDYSLAICGASYYFRGPNFTSGYVLYAILFSMVDVGLHLALDNGMIRYLMEIPLIEVSRSVR
jgi:hypothetical protein